MSTKNIILLSTSDTGFAIPYMMDQTIMRHWVARSIRLKKKKKVTRRVHKMTRNQTAPWNQRNSINLIFIITVYISKVIQETSFIIRKGVVSINMLLLWGRVFNSLPEEWEMNSTYINKREGDNYWSVTLKVQAKEVIMNF